MPVELSSRVTALPRVGPAISARLKSLGITTTEDLLKHYPFRYDDFSKCLPISRVSPDMAVTVRGQIEFIRARRSFRRRLTITEALIRDRTGTIRAVWFNQPHLVTALPPGTMVTLSGQASSGLPTLQLTNPSYEKLSADPVHVGRLVPIYPLTQGLGQRQVRTLIKTVLPLASQLSDPLPEPIRRQAKLLTLKQAIQLAHFPRTLVDVKNARYRLGFDELFLHFLGVLHIRALMNSFTAPDIPFRERETRQFVARLPFVLTAGQKRAAWTILRDLAKPRPMNRLLEGEVGSGKTVVTALAMLNAAANGYQSAFMAPTSILAEQHERTLRQMFAHTGHGLAMWTSGRLTIDGSEVSRSKMLQAMRSGEVAVIIGTHALLNGAIKFHRLGLVVVDEQHHFGVEQRLKLRQQVSLDPKTIPHFLSLSATPIPRTLALTLFGDLDVTQLHEHPLGRPVITTRLMAEDGRARVEEMILKETGSGHQVFVICPLIDESDFLGVRTVKDTARQLAERFPKIHIDVLHGQMTARAKNLVLEKFSNKEIGILVATPVVEVGIDIPNATVMVIEGAERFGLAQLHQMRGRIGRGQLPGYCFLMAQSRNDARRQRLEAVVNSQDGFALADADLKFRGPGSLAGLRQSGLTDFQIADLTNLDSLNLVRTMAEKLLQQDPELRRWPLLQQKLSQQSSDLNRALE